MRGSLLAVLFINQGGWMITGDHQPHRCSAVDARRGRAGALSVLAVLGFDRVRWPACRSACKERSCPLLVLGRDRCRRARRRGAGAGAGAVDRQAGDISVVTADVKFEPKNLTADAGDIGIIVKNDDLFWHTLTISDLDENVTVATSGRKRLQFRDVEPGTYEFVCAIPGHESAGMTGTLVVT